MENNEIGRRPDLTKFAKTKALLVKSYFLEDNNMTVSEICTEGGISRNTYY